MKRIMISFALFFFVALFAYAGNVPPEINYQGYVTSGGSAFSGTGYFKFSLIDDEDSPTTNYWTNDGSSPPSAGGEPTSAISTTVSSGVFNVILGDTSITNMTEISTSVFTDNTTVYLRVWFRSTASGSFEMLSPDKKITSRAYAYNAYEAYTVESAIQAAVKLCPFNTASGNTGEIRFLELAANGTNYVGFKAPDSIDPDCIWTLPSADGTSGQVLKTDSVKVLSWTTQSSSGANTTLSNLTDTVAINKSLIAGGAEATHDLGSSGISWKDIYTRTVKFDGSESGTTTVQATAAAGTTTLVLPAETDTDTLIGKATTDTLTNKTLTSPVINGGTIDGTIIGATTPATGTFTIATAKTSVKLEDPGVGTNTVTMQAPALAGDYSLTFPTALPGSIAFLKISNAGVMTTDTNTYLTSLSGVLLADGSIPLTDNWAMGAKSLTGGKDATFTGTVSAEQLTSTDDAAITNLLTVPNINGSTVENDDITIQGTSSGTKTTSYVNLQPTGGNVGIGTPTPLAKLHAVTDDTVTNAVTVVARITHSTTGTAAAGIGTSLTLYSEDASGNIEEAGRIQAVFPVAAHATQTARVDITALSAAAGTGISVLNSGNVGIGITAPSCQLNTANISQYSTGTASQSGYGVTGVGTTWTLAMVGLQFIYADGVSVGAITDFNSVTSLTVSLSRTVTPAQAYSINYSGLNVKSFGNVGIGTITDASYSTLQVLDRIKFEPVIAGGSRAGTYLGYYAGNSYRTWGNPEGVYNTMVGYQAGLNNTTGWSGTSVGCYAGYNGGGGGANLGYLAGGYSNGSDCLGYHAGYCSITGVFIGSLTGGGGSNTYIGQYAGYANSTGNYAGAANVFVGASAGYSNYSGTSNTFIGYHAGLNNTTGNYNTFIGFAAGDYAYTGPTNNNIVIGFNIDLPTTTSTRMLNIGNLIFATGVNGTTTTVSTGCVGIGTASPTASLTVAQGTKGIGTVSNEAGGTIVTGAGTQFTNTFKVGDTITIGGQTVAISVITDDYTMTTAAITNANIHVAYTLTGGTRLAVLGNGKVGIGTTTPTAYLHLKAGTATASTAPLKFTTSAGTYLATPEAGAMEYDGTSLYFTPTGTTREIIAYADATAQTLGEGATTFAITSSNVITITGHALGNPIATITGGVSGQELTLIFVDILVTITDNGGGHDPDTIDLSAAFTSADDKVLKLVRDGTSWHEVSRSVN